MKCPECKNKIVVVDEVRTPDNEVYRRNRCSECGHLFYSVEYEIEADKQLRDIWRKNKKEVNENGRRN